ncbi:hypothetical protein AB6802_13070 [Mesorhizobium sp. RCC_202]|uniref:hypothetical protein n=1 Tax=Mesorhizobium sp. RCC_202 TaxID=3239222 RepID=UPI003523C868
MAAVLAARNRDAQIIGVVDQTSTTTDPAFESCRLGEAIQFVANASILGYDVRSAIVLSEESGTPNLRLRECDQLWTKYGQALLQSD